MKYSKISAFITAACLTISLAPANLLTTANAINYAWTDAEDSVDYDDVRYDLFPDHAVVSYCGEKKGDVVIPSEIKGLPVTKIFDGAFYSEDITSITLPDTIDELSENMCDGCINLTSIKLPANIKSIPEFAFHGCKSLKKVDIPSGVTSIGRAAFSGCTSLKEVKLPESLEVLSDSCFSDCALESIDFPKGITEIPIRSFTNNKFKEITLPENITKIDSWAFFECYDIEKLTILNPDCEISSRLDFVFGGGRRDENGEPTEKRVPCTCYGYKGSTLEKLANESTAKSAGFTFVALDAEKTVSLGDPNGDGKINAVDASIILSDYARFSTSDDKPTTDELSTGDVDKNGAVNAVDASVVLSYYAYSSTTKAPQSFTDYLANA
ncbi:MAG: leucine-rich repeat protein [Ruminococcus sp.]|uniref:leucine-rich repeat protein n=1 Tax=Ruminococcus flavefaciens TaxID=1265 RepID=UPI0026F271E3|nr:leucine-rich repeat protein [Ruminococcus flavefaciens]MBR0511411.1 leucine-rich repeat protein [Ruminococcus sp.]